MRAIRKIVLPPSSFVMGRLWTALQTHKFDDSVQTLKKRLPGGRRRRRRNPQEMLQGAADAAPQGVMTAAAAREAYRRLVDQP